MLPILLAAAKALPQAGEDYEMCLENEDFKRKTGDITRQIESLLSRLTANLVSPACHFPLSEMDEERVYALCAKLQESALTRSDTAKGLSSLKERVHITSKAIAGAPTSNSAGDAVVPSSEKRPQDSFADRADNSRSTLFNPANKLPSKPHAMRESLAESTALQLGPRILPDDNLDDEEDAPAAPYYRNPYEAEIQLALRTNVPQWLFDSQLVACPLRVREKAKRKRRPTLDSLETTPFAFVDQPDQLADMASHLAEQRVFAVDLEHHSQRSFQGFSCVMQISSLERDFVVDILALRSHVGDALRSLFADPNIVKVLHGADSDVKWLQKDFGLYLVQLFDTGQAARVLNYPSAGLSFALDRHCQVQANKSLQLADWRVRPLSREMLVYAREDTHFLLGIFDRMRTELLTTQQGKQALESVLERSADIASRAYEKLVFTPKTYLDLAGVDSTDQERLVLAALVDWRDATARELDESTEFLLPNRGVKRLAKVAPNTVLELIREVDTLNASAYVKANVETLLQVIQQGKSGGGSVSVAAAAAVAAAPTDEQPPKKKARRSTTTTSSGVVVAEVAPTAGVVNSNLGFYMGVNAAHAIVPHSAAAVVVALLSSSAVKPVSFSPVATLASSGGLFGLAPPPFVFNMDRVLELKQRLVEKEAEEMQTRMAGVENAQAAADDLLNELSGGGGGGGAPKSAAAPAKIQSVVEAYGHKPVQLMPSKRGAVAAAARMLADGEEEEEEEEEVNEQQDGAAASAAKYEFTMEKAVQAGVVPAPPTEEELAQQQRKKAGGKNAKPQREELGPTTTKEPKKKNPYMLMPSKRQAGKTTTYVPKD